MRRRTCPFPLQTEYGSRSDAFLNGFPCAVLPPIFGKKNCQTKVGMRIDPAVDSKQSMRGSQRLRLRPNLVLAVGLAMAPMTAAAGDYSVRDVDTVVVDGVPVRLQGVDGPELGTSSGRDAKRWMVNYLRTGTNLRCDLTGERTYDRYVGVCYLDGKDIGAAAIAAGQALDCARYSDGRYRHLETPAAKSRLKRARYC